MKKLLTYLIFGLIPIMILAQNYNDKSHHTKNGFRNPFPGFEGKNFGDFLQWSLIDRIKG